MPQQIKFKTQEEMCHHLKGVDPFQKPKTPSIRNLIGRWIPIWLLTWL